MTASNSRDRASHLQLWFGFTGGILVFALAISIVIHLSASTIYTDDGSSISILDEDSWPGRIVRVVPDRHGCIVTLSSQESGALPHQLYWVDETHIYRCAPLARPILAVDTRLSPRRDLPNERWHQLALLVPFGLEPTERRFTGPPAPVRQRLLTDFWRDEKESQAPANFIGAIGFLLLVFAACLDKYR